MSETSYSSLIRELAIDYYYRRIDTVDYRARRRDVLDEVDRVYNGGAQPAVSGAGAEGTEPVTDRMKTVIFTTPGCHRDAAGD